METDLDVLVIGGGPVGLFCAHELCRHGISPKRIRIIDKRPEQKLWAKAVGIQSRTQEIFYASSKDLSDSIQQQSILQKSAKLYQYPDPKNLINNNDNKISLKLSVKINFSELDSEFNYMLSLEQYNTENKIANELNKKYGVKLERGIELIDFIDKGSYVLVKLDKYKKKKIDDEKDSKSSEEIDNLPQELRVKYLIGCDGARSFVRSKLNLPFIGETYDEKFLLFHGYINHQNQLEMPSTFIVSGINGFLFVITMSDNSWIIVADLDEKQQKLYHNGKFEMPTKSDFEKIFNQRGLNGFKITDVKWLTKFEVQSRQIAQYSKGIQFIYILYKMFLFFC